MTEEARAARNAYKREWAKKNPDKVKAIQDRYWTRRAAKLRTSGDGENKGSENTN